MREVTQVNKGKPPINVSFSRIKVVCQCQAMRPRLYVPSGDAVSLPTFYHLYFFSYPVVFEIEHIDPT